MDWTAFSEFRRDYLKGRVDAPPAEHPDFLDKLRDMQTAQWRNLKLINDTIGVETMELSEFLTRCRL